MCQVMVGTPECDEPDMDVLQWQSRVGMFAELMDCPVLGAVAPTLQR